MVATLEKVSNGWLITIPTLIQPDKALFHQSEIKCEDKRYVFANLESALGFLRKEFEVSE